MAMLIGDSIVIPILNDVSNGLDRHDWKIKYSSLMNFGAILSGPTQNYISEKVSPVINILLNNF